MQDLKNLILISIMDRKWSGTYQEIYITKGNIKWNNKAQHNTTRH